MRRVIRIIQEQRDARYSLLRGFFRGADDGSTDEWQQERLSSLSLPLRARSVGRKLGDIALSALGVQLVSLRRKSGQVMVLTDDLVLMEGDALVLSGKADPIRQAEQLLLKG
jgi:CPA2 family monovalent cation:H+ antiporter-2